MSCKICGGRLIILDELTSHLICDNCNYEEQYGDVLFDDTTEEEIIVKIYNGGKSLII